MLLLKEREQAHLQPARLQLDFEANYKAFNLKRKKATLNFEGRFS
jgi:hypothetical protein